MTARAVEFRARESSSDFRGEFPMSLETEARGDDKTVKQATPRKELRRGARRSHVFDRERRGAAMALKFVANIEI